MLVIYTVLYDAPDVSDGLTRATAILYSCMLAACSLQSWRLAGAEVELATKLSHPGPPILVSWFLQRRRRKNQVGVVCVCVCV